MCCCRCKDRFGVVLIYLFLLLLPLPLPLPLLLPLPSQQVCVVLQTVHVRQQQLRRLQWDHVLQVIVLIPGGEDIWMGRLSVKGNVGG